MHPIGIAIIRGIYSLLLGCQLIAIGLSTMLEAASGHRATFKVEWKMTEHSHVVHSVSVVTLPSNVNMHLCRRSASSKEKSKVTEPVTSS